ASAVTRREQRRMTAAAQRGPMSAPKCTVAARESRAALVLAVLALVALLACTAERSGSASPSPVPSPSPTPDDTALIRDVDAIAADALQRGPIAGLSIGVFRHGQPVLAKGYGFSDVEAGTAASGETSYPIASVSKHFTAAAVLRLADQGKLGLDDPLSRFFP